MWGICMPIFRPITSMVWEEEEETGGRMDNNILAAIRNENSKLPPLL